MKNLRKHFAMLVLAVIGSALSVGAQNKAVLVEKVETQPGKVIIPYSKYKLPNGLTFIIHEDHSDPVVHVEMTYHVGSARESPGKSGFAHFFEHMMFQGSENVGDEQHFKIISNAGGTMNGTTNRDRTNYYQTIPSNQVEVALWLEADRMGFLLPAVTKKKFEVQRATVKNEKDQRYGVPYGMVGEVRDQVLYPSNHPYSWSTIGFIDDLNRVDEGDLKNFFLRWYGPNNAILVVAGDVNTDEVVAMVEKYFGSINRGPEVSKQSIARVVIPDPVSRVVKDDIFLPLTIMTYPSVPTYHPDEAALDLLSQLMAGGKNSIFYKKFEKAEKALQASVSNPTFELAGEFTIQVVNYPGMRESETKDLILEAINEFEKDGFKPEDLERVKIGMVSNFYSYMESVASKAGFLTQSEMLLADKKHNVEQEIERYKKVKMEDIWRVYRTYIKGKNYAILHVVPFAEGEKVVAYESYNPNVNAPDPYKSQYEGLVYNKPVDNFDRSIQPKPSAAKPVNAPKFYRSKLANGIEIVGTTECEVPRVYMRIVVSGGHMFEDGKNVKNGTAFMCAQMLNEGTTKYTSSEIGDELEKIGSSIFFSATNTGINATVECFEGELDKTLALLEQKLLFPNFDPEDFKLSKKQVLESIRNQSKQQGLMANKGFSRLLYGDNNPLGTFAMGDYSVMNSIKLEEVVAFYNKFMSPHLTRIVVVGNVKEEVINQKLAFLNSWEKKNIELPVYNVAYPFETNQVFLINKSYARQSEVLLGYQSLTFDPMGEYFKASAMNFILGGNFNSRLNLNLREDKGWTYGIRSSFGSGGKSHPGYYVVSAGIKRDATDSAIIEIVKEMNMFRDKGITQEEFDFMKSSLISSDALNYETPYDKLGYLSFIAEYNLPLDFKQKQIDILNSLTIQEVNELAKKHLNVSNFFILVVGDSYHLTPKLEALGYGKPQILDNNGQGKVKINKKK